MNADTAAPTAARTETRVAVSAIVTRANGEVTDLGIVNYWHRNPFKRLGHRLFRAPLVEHRIRQFNRHSATSE